jgi:hypothetical protein
MPSLLELSHCSILRVLVVGDTLCQSDTLRQAGGMIADDHLDQLFGQADFSESHRRVVHAPPERVWAAALAVRPRWSIRVTT